MDPRASPGPRPLWSYNNVQNQYLNTAETLRGAMAANQFLKVFVANGYYDGATPFFATEYTFFQTDLGGDLKGRVKMSYYEAGHMMYIHKPSHAKLKADLPSSSGTPRESNSQRLCVLWVRSCSTR